MLSFVVIISCGVPKHIRNDFSILYDSINFKVDTILKINGYYTIPKQYFSPRFEKPNFRGKYTTALDTFYLNYIFFEDGLYARNFSPNIPDTVIKYLKEIAHDTNTTGLLKRSFYQGPYWGIYRIDGDTLITQSINNPCTPKVWVATEERFFILKNNSILQFSTKVLGKYPKYDMEIWAQEEKDKKYNPAIFIPVTILPESNSWLKKEKWFWKDEAEYLKWQSKKK